MVKKSILNVPLLSPAWRKVAYLFFPLPILLVLGMGLVRVDSDPIDAGEIIYGFWAIGFTMLNLTREKKEDEMIKTFRLQAFQTGFYWLIWGLGAIMLINYLRFGNIHSEFFSAYLVLFLLNAYIYGAFHYQKYISSKDLT